jgi:hypothetical protein
MAGIKIVDLPAVGRDLAATDLFEMSLAGGTGSRKITGQEIMNASKLSVNNTPVINGTAGRIFFQGSTNVLQQSGNLFWDDVNGRLGVGTSNPQARYHQSQTQGIFARYDVTNANADQNRGVWEFYTNTAATPDFFGRFGFKFEGGINNAARQFQLHVGDNTTPRFVVNGNGNVLINTTTDAGFKLDVNGTARVSGLIDSTNTFTSIGAFSTGIGLSKTTLNSSTSFSEVISVQGLARSLNNFAYRVYGVKGIGATDGSFGTQSIEILTGLQGAISVGNGNKTVTTAMSLFASAESIGTGNTITNYYGAYLQTPSGTTITNKWGLFQQDTTSKNYFGGNVLIGTTTDAGFRLDVNGLARVRGTSLTDYGFTVANSTNNLMFFGAGASNGGLPTISSATGRLFIYPTEGTLTRYVDFSNTYVRFNEVILEGAGGQNNINLYVGGNGALRLTTTISTNPIEFFTNNNNRASITASTGNFLIGTATDAGFRLDVNGTARVGNVQITGGSTAGVANTLRVFNGNNFGLSIWGEVNDPVIASFNSICIGRYQTSPTQGALTNQTMYFDLAGQKACVGNGGSLNIIEFSASFEVKSTTKGFLPPRMTQTQRNAIASPAIGLEIYQTDATEGKYIYKSSGWTYIG